MDREFTRIYNLYKDDIYRLAFSYTKNIQDTDDIVQNVFIKLYKHSKMLTDTNDFNIKKWLVVVTINECKTIFMSSWKRKILFLGDDNAKVISSLIKSNDMLDAIMNLSKRSRIIIYLYYYEGYKIKEISSIIKLSETNIQNILSKARNELKQYLEENW